MCKGNALRQIVARAGRVTGETSDFDLNPEYRQPWGYRLRPAAVLLAFTEHQEGLRLILTKRSAALRHHPGQIAFPGGKVDLQDRCAEDTALREAEEEIGLMRDNVEVLALLPPHKTVTGFSVQPVLGRVRDKFLPRPEKGEVEEIFSVPYAFLADPENFVVQSRIWQSRPRYYYTIPHGPYYIWGATARILYALARAAAA